MRARMKGECEVVEVTQAMLWLGEGEGIPDWARDSISWRYKGYGEHDVSCNGRAFKAGDYFVRWPHGDVSVINHQQFNTLFD